MISGRGCLSMRAADVSPAAVLLPAWAYFPAVLSRAARPGPVTPMNFPSYGKTR